MRVWKEELIGRNIEVVKARNVSLEGLKGKVVGESKNMLVLETADGEKKLVKEQVVLRMRVGRKVVEVDGKSLVGKGYERVKK